MFYCVLSEIKNINEKLILEVLYMYVTNADFIREWNKEAILTQNVLDGLTDDSLKQQVYPEGRTLGRIAWHLTTSIPEYLPFATSHVLLL